MPDFHDPQNERERPLLSLCMIVRDCEETLGQALKSVCPFVDEMVVVDTGSVDKTREVAAENGAILFDFEWCDDFSAARNYSLEQATCDWIFWIDADDVLPPESGRKLRPLIAEYPNRDAAFWVDVEQELIDKNNQKRKTSHGHLKVFPRHSDIRFQYRVHEQVAPSIKKLGFPFKASGVIVKHAHADRSEEGNRRRIERNLRLLHLDVVDYPDDPFVFLNLAMTNLHMPDGPAKSIEYAQKSLSGFQSGSSGRISGYSILASAFRLNGDPEAELQTCVEARKEFPDDASLLLRLGGIYKRRGELDQAAECLGAIVNTGKLRRSVLHFADTQSQAVLQLSQVHLQQGRRDRAEQVLRRFLKRHPKEHAVRKALEDCLVSSYSIDCSRHS